ncbi:asparaginyl-tRNA synthetase-like [Dysidea avara]|uniref:asparaginyl-tRNA synthetase-like n=1 Tax=Dysidea avara TaxID=196820 RepID=UPI00333085B9
MKLLSLVRSLRIQARTLHCGVLHCDAAKGVKRVSTIRECLELSADSHVLNTRGCVQAVRKHKDVVFIDISDGSTSSCLQVVFDANKVPSAIDVTLGSSVAVTGQLCTARTQVELQANNVEVIGTCDPVNFPFKAHGRHPLEYMRHYPHLRPKTREFSSLLRIRNAATMAVHDFFQRHGYLLVHTPIITSCDCEGAGEMFTVSSTSHDNFFGSSAHLTVSGQLHAEAMTCAAIPVYTFGPTFRAEESHTKRHLSEFYMIEAEIPFTQHINDVAIVIEELYKYVVRKLLEQCNDDINLAVKKAGHDESYKERLLQSTEEPFKYIAYTEAVELLKSRHKQSQFQFEPKWGDDLHIEHERFIIDYHKDTPTFVTDFPRKLKPFYSRSQQDEQTTASLDLLVPHVGELAGGTLREERLDKLEHRLKELEINEEHYGWYLDLRRFGTLPHGGFGMGFERLLQVILDWDVRDTIPFPRYHQSCKL